MPKSEIIMNLRVKITVENDILSRILTAEKPNNILFTDMVYIADIPYRELADKAVIENGCDDYKIVVIKPVGV